MRTRCRGDAMDAFMSDLFDVRGVDHTVFLDPATGNLSHAALMRDQRLIHNASFRFAWQHLSGGVLPSARCYAEFVVGRSPDLMLEVKAVGDWLLGPEGPFHIMGRSDLMRGRLARLSDGRFESFVTLLKDPTSSVLHRTLVEKLIDRYDGSGSGGGSGLGSKVKGYMKRSLFINQRDLVSKAGCIDPSDELLNFASGMIASIEEERDQSTGVGSKACNAPVRVGRADAIKRRFARDLDFQRRQFGRHYVTATEDLMSFAQCVCVAIGAPWVVEERQASEVERHSPVIADACVRLHRYGTCELRAPVITIRDPAGRPPASMLILFGVDGVSDAELARFGTAHGYQRTFRAHTDTDVQHPDLLASQDGGPVYSLYFGEGGTDHWSFGILSACLSKHLISSCPLQSLDPVDASSLVGRCTTRIAVMRGIFGRGRVFETSPSSRWVILAVDSRPDPSATILSVCIALSTFKRTTDWTVHIMCSRRNRSEFERMLSPMCPCARYEENPILNVPYKTFEIESIYNKLMKSPSTWTSLLPAKVVLVVQDDGLLIRPGIEKIIEDGVPYLGAPWADAPCNANIRAMVPTLVGNGGLSLRNVRSMITMSEGIGDKERRRLFFNRLQSVPEDVLFSGLACLSDAQAESATRLSCEQVPCPFALGFHKPWPYWTVPQTHKHMQMLIDETSKQLCWIASGDASAPASRS